VVENLKTAEQVAQIIGVTKGEVWKWARAGRLPAVRLGRRVVRFRDEDVNAFIRAHLNYDAVAAAIADGADVARGPAS
jgi:excisionase family DNA binding protein